MTGNFSPPQAPSFLAQALYNEKPPARDPTGRGLYSLTYLTIGILLRERD